MHAAAAAGSTRGAPRRPRAPLASPREGGRYIKNAAWRCPFLLGLFFTHKKRPSRARWSACSLGVTANDVLIRRRRARRTPAFPPPPFFFPPRATSGRAATTCSTKDVASTSRTFPGHMWDPERAHVGLRTGTTCVTRTRTRTGPAEPLAKQTVNGRSATRGFPTPTNAPLAGVHQVHTGIDDRGLVCRRRPDRKMER